MQQQFRRGDRAAAVAEFRAKLAQIGFPVESADPQFFDDRVDDAVRSFQQARGLTVDGIVGADTLRRLEEAKWSLGDRPLSFIPGHLIYGDDVISLQQRLTAMGFDCGKIDGIFGVQTDRALREFQTSVGEPVDGIAGTATFAALQRLTRTVSGGHAERLRQSVLLESLRTGIADKTIVLDPGHGGGDTGVRANGATESDITAAVVGRIQGKLAALGATVVLTRPLRQAKRKDDPQRAEIANSVGADLVVSVHCDAATSVAAAGIATFHYGAENGGWSHSGERAAQRIHTAVLERTGAADCQVHGRTWDILRMTRMPAVRVEIGYLTSPTEAIRLLDADYQEQLAAGITAGIVKFFAPA